MVSRPLVAAGSLAVLVTGCLPPRDNPIDPSISPKPVLLFRTAGLPEDGLCPALLSSAETVSIAGRGECLTLDASLSDDPQGDSLRFRFSYLGTNGFIALHADPVESSLFEVSPGFLRRFDPNAPATFRLEARDGHGHFGAVEEELVVSDTEPVVAPISPRRVPLGGFPWSGDLPIDFRATATDADGDADFTYCWDFLDLPPAGTCTLLPENGRLCSSDPEDPCFTRLLPPDVPRGHRPTIVVRDDGGASSTAVTSPVSVSPAVVWTRAGGNIIGSHFERIDGERISLGFAEYVRVALFDEISPPVVVVADRPVNDYQVHLATYPDAKPQGTPIPLAPANSGGIGADPGNLRLWTAGTPYTPPSSNSTTTIRTWLVDPLGMTLSPELTVDIVENDKSANANSRIAVDGDGNAWIARESTSVAELHVVSPSGTVTDLALAPSRWQGLAARPGSGEIWTQRVSDPFQTDVPFEQARIVRFSSPTSSVEYETGIDTTVSLAFAGPDRLWMGSPTDGLYLLDVPALETSGFDAAVLQHFDLIVMAEIAADPVTGACFGVDTQGGFRAGENGELSHYEAAGAPGVADHEGQIWFGAISGFPGLFRGESNAAFGTVAALEIPFALSPNVDILTGGVVVQGVGIPGIASISADGNSIRFATRTRYVGSNDDVAFPFLFPLRTAPGTRSIWGIARTGGIAGTAGVDRFDLSTNPTQATRIADGTFAGDLLLLEPSSPGSALPPSAWIVRESLADVGLLYENGTVTSLFTIPSNERIGSTLKIVGARALRTNALCLATIEDDGGATRNLRMRRIEEGGSTTLLATIALPLDYAIPGVSAASEPAGSLERDACWVAVVDSSTALYSTSQTTIEGWKVSGVPVHPAHVEIGGHITSLMMSSPDRIWFSVERRLDLDGSPGEETVLFDQHRLSWNGASWSREAFEDVDHFLYFNGQEASARPF